MLCRVANRTERAFEFAMLSHGLMPELASNPRARCETMSAIIAKSRDGFPRFALGALLAFVALNAFGGGVYGVLGAKDLPTEWLQGTPFRDYLIPSVALFVAVGGPCLFAAVSVFRRHSWARPAAFAAGTIVLVWMTVQLLLIGYVSWLQPTFVVIALLVLALAGLAPRRQKIERRDDLGA